MTKKKISIKRVDGVTQGYHVGSGVDGLQSMDDVPKTGFVGFNTAEDSMSSLEERFLKAKEAITQVPDNPYKIALLQNVDGEMVKVYCDRVDWQNCRVHGSASLFLTKADGTRFVPNYLNPDSEKTLKEESLAVIHNNFPKWAKEYLQPLKPEGVFWYRTKHEKWDTAEFGMVHSNLYGSPGLPTYLKISGILRGDKTFNQDVEIKVRVSENGDGEINTFYAAPSEYRPPNRRGIARGMFEINTSVPKEMMNETGIKAKLKEHCDSVLNSIDEIAAIFNVEQ